MTDRRHMIWKQNGLAVEVFTVNDDEADAIHLLTLDDPAEADELLNLIDDALGGCTTCGEPMWLATGGDCGVRGPYCCSHPQHGPSSECDERLAI